MGSRRSTAERLSCATRRLTACSCTGLALYTVNEIIDWYPTREQAEEAVAQVIADEPEFVGIVGVEAIELEIAPN